MDEQFEITDSFLEIAAGRGISIEEIRHVLNDINSKWEPGRGQASTIIEGHTPGGRCLGIPIEDGEQAAFRPVTVYVIEQPKAFVDRRDIERLRWERRKGSKRNDAD